MTKDEIFQKIKPILTSHLSTTGNPRDPFEEKVTLEAKLEEDLGADSLDRVELVMVYEEDFDIDLGDTEVGDNKCVTVSDQVDRIAAALDAKANAG